MEQSPTKATQAGGGIDSIFNYNQHHNDLNKVTQSVFGGADENSVTGSIDNMQLSRSPSANQNQRRQQQQYVDYRQQRQQHLQYQQQLQELIYNSPVKSDSPQRHLMFNSPSPGSPRGHANSMATGSSGTLRVNCAVKSETSQQQFVSCVFSPSATSSPSAASLLSQSPSYISSPLSSGISSPFGVENASCTAMARQDVVSTVKRHFMVKEEMPSPSLSSPGQVAYLPSPNKTLTSACKRRLDFNHNVPEDGNNINARFNQNINQSSNQNTSFSQKSPFSHHYNHLQLSMQQADVKPFQTDAFQHDLSQLHRDLTQHQQDVNLNEIGPRRDIGQEAAALGRVPAVAVARRNERERNRVKLINMTFATLREHLPQSLHKGSNSKNKKMSKVETLRAAIDYIRQLHAVIKERQAAGTLGQHAPNSEDTENIHSGGSLEASLGVESLEMVDVASDCLSTSKSAASVRQAVSQVSPLSSAGGGGQSPLSDDCCSTYDQLSAEEEDLLDFACWF